MPLPTLPLIGPSRFFPGIDSDPHTSKHAVLPLPTEGQLRGKRQSLSSCQTLTPMTLELGGKSPAFIDQGPRAWSAKLYLAASGKQVANQEQLSGGFVPR